MSSYDRSPYYDQVRAEYTAHTIHEQSRFITLCGFCRYFYVSGPDYETGEVDVDCRHPLAQTTRKSRKDGELYYKDGSVPFESASVGGDCWAFRPVWGTACKIPRDIYPDSARSDYIHREAPGKRIAELIEMGEEAQLQLQEEYYEQYYREHPEWAKLDERDPNTGKRI